MNAFLLVFGGFFAIIGLVIVGVGWQERKRHQLVTATPTTDIRAIDSEGLVELTGTISGPAGNGFVSPLGQTAETVFATWAIEEWSSGSENEGGTWATCASGIESVPFYLDDGTGQIRVAIGDRSGDVTCEFEEVPIVTAVGVDSQAPAHIKAFQDERGIDEPSGSVLDLDIGDGPAFGDRRYSELALGPGEEIYLLGHVRADEGATTPLHPEDAVVTPVNDELFLISDLAEDDLTDQISSGSRLFFAIGALFTVIGVGLIIIATSL